MRTLSSICLCALGSTAQMSFHLTQDQTLEAEKRLFTEFKTKFKRSYKSDESYRFGVFQENLKIAQEMDARDNNPVPRSHLSPFADWTQKEFEEYIHLHSSSSKNSKSSTNLFDKFMGILGSPKETIPVVPADLGGQEQVKEILKSVGEEGIDWREKGAVNEVKNQGQCGSCWSFATVANIEGAGFVETGKLLDLSEQQLVDCDKSDNGCNGGLPEQADKWLIAHHEGLELEKDYPYTGVAGECQEHKEKERLWVGKFLTISQDESEMAAALVKYGPMSIGINAGTMQMYMGGVQQPSQEDCDPEALNHGVTLVGYGSEAAVSQPQLRKNLLRMQSMVFGGEYALENLKLQSTNGDGDTVPFWIIRNSWGPEWGEKGYYRIIRGKGACGCNQLVTTAQEISNKAPDLKRGNSKKVEKRVEEKKVEIAQAVAGEAEVYV